MVAGEEVAEAVAVGEARAARGGRGESIAVTKAWDAITSDSIVGTDQTDLGFWRRVLVAYDNFKPVDAKPRKPDQIRKKWGRIARACKRLAGIYENNLRTAESRRSQADIKALSESMYNTDGWPKFTYWEEFLLLQDCPKFRAICEEERAAASGSALKRTRLGVSGNYSSSGSRSIDLNEDV